MKTTELRQAELRRRLNEELVQTRLRNPSYSLRAFAKRLGISPAALSEILHGKRPVSGKTAARIAERLMWAPDVKAEMAAIPRYQRAGAEKESVQLTMDHFHSIADWYHFAILSLAETEDYRDDAAWIGRRLGIPKTTAQAALDRLERLGMLERNAAGHLFSSGTSYSSSDEIVSLALRRSHAQNLELARKSLEQDAVEERDFTAATMAIDPARLPEAKKMIRQFRAELCAFLEGGAKKEVFKFCMQLMPLSKDGEEK